MQPLRPIIVQPQQPIIVQQLFNISELLKLLKQSPQNIQKLHPATINEVLRVRNNEISIKFLLKEQMPHIDVRSLTPQQISELSSEALNKMSPEQLYQLNICQTNRISLENISKFQDIEQVAALGTRVLQFQQQYTLDHALTNENSKNFKQVTHINAIMQHYLASKNTLAIQSNR